jgi:predicted transcriptional regulator
MPISVRLKPELERRLDAACRRERKNRSALVHEALAADLTPKGRNLADVISEALAASPGGFRLERNQPSAGDKRNWKR